MPNKLCLPQWLQVNDLPWLTPKTLKVVHLLLMSYQHAFGESLLPSSKIFNSEVEKGQELYTMQNPIISHNNAKDPCLNYANYAALQLWNRCWDEMIGMPSRLTAPKKEQIKRTNILKEATENNPIKNYKGIRINSKGELFMIENTQIWTISNNKGHTYGQAATFDHWWKI